MSVIAATLTRIFYPRSIWRLSASDGIVVTFDDGPGPVTRPILDWAATRGVRLLFFVNSNPARKNPGLVRAMAAGGHRIGSHFLTHKSYWLSGKKQFQDELVTSLQILEDIIGQEIGLCRVPYGRILPWQESWISELGLLHIFWTVNSRDYLGRPLEYYRKRLGSKINRGDILLFHDGNTCHPDIIRILDLLAGDDRLRIGDPDRLMSATPITREEYPVD